MHPLLQIQNLCVDFETDQGITTALRGVSFEVNRGEIVGIVGESGSGKTVTSLSILQLLPAKSVRYTSGSISFSPEGTAQKDLLQQNEAAIRSIRGNQIAMIFQEPMTSLNPVYSCGHQVMEAIVMHQKLSFHEAKQKTLELFEKVKLPGSRVMFDKYPHQLSGGQKQRIMIAMAVSCNPSLLICDEPTTALDVTVQKTILELIKELLTGQNMGVILISHDFGVVAEVADQVVVMYKGKIVEQGPVLQIIQQPSHPYTKGLLACRPVMHRKGERLPVVGDFMEVGENGEIAEKIRVTPVFPNPVAEPLIQISEVVPVPPQEKLITVEHLRVWYPSRKTFLGKTQDYLKAVEDVNFDVYKRETLGLVGESGCGKTTLGRSLLRLVEPTSGKIIFNGRDLLKYTQAQLRPLRKDIQIVFQDPYSSLNPRITIGNAIQEVLKVHQLISTTNDRKDRVIALLEKVSLKPEHFHRYPHEFSGGQRQRIVIARALALNPSFIVCDESVSSLDVSVQAQVLNLLNDLKVEFGFTVIFISHDLSVVHYISDRIMVMKEGKIVEMGTSDNVFYHPENSYTQRLIASIPK